MGIDINLARLLFSARERGVAFDRTLTLGAQELHVSKKDRERLFPNHDAKSISDGPALLRALGAETVDAVDVSDYEGAAILHDLNDPIGDEYKEICSVLIDGGTLEHLFNFSCGLRNAMSMVEEGGHLITYNPANNFLGHGFYQCSPELYFRALSPENGFEVERVVLVEEGGGWYEVTDPAAVRSRVQVINDRPTFIYVQARRTKVLPIFETWPQQSDYQMIWSDYADEASVRLTPMTNRVRKRLREIKPLWSLLRRLKHAARAPGDRRRRSFENRTHFRPVDR